MTGESERSAARRVGHTEYDSDCLWRARAFTSGYAENLPHSSRNGLTVFAPRGLRLILSAGTKLPSHAHTWDQLVYAREGVLTVVTDNATAQAADDRLNSGQSRWVVPRTLAVWIPSGLHHSLRSDVRATLDAVYVMPDVARDAGWRSENRPIVLAVSPLLSELIRFVVDGAMLGDQERERTESTVVVAEAGAPTADSLAHAAALLVAIAQRTHVHPLRVCEPRDSRARAVAALLEQSPGDARGLEALGHVVGASARTLERCFLRETGLTFREWRQQVRLEHALRRLAGGESVSTVSFAVGYDSPSAFIAMFRRQLGVTPTAYFPAARAST